MLGGPKIGYREGLHVIWRFSWESTAIEVDKAASDLFNFFRIPYLSVLVW